MVRFHWHVEDQLGAHVPQGGILVDPHTGVTHCNLEIELAGQNVSLQGLITLPPNYLVDGATRDVGVVLAHGTQADTWRGKLLSEISNTLAKAGYIVMRYHCAGKEQRRLRIFEKAVDTAAMSPFARHVTRWVLAGVGNGARVAASVGGKCRGYMAGYALMGYPLMEPVSVFKGPTAPNSIGPLTKLNAPLLFVHPEHHDQATADQIKGVLDQLPSWDVRLVEVPGVDAMFRDNQTHASPTAEVRSLLATKVLEFVDAVSHNSLEMNHSLPRVKAAPPPPVIIPNNMRPPLSAPPHHLVNHPNVSHPANVPGVLEAGLKNKPKPPPGTPPLAAPPPAAAAQPAQGQGTGAEGGQVQGVAAVAPAGAGAAQQGTVLELGGDGLGAGMQGQAGEGGQAAVGGDGSAPGGALEGEPDAKRARMEVDLGDAAGLPQAGDAGDGADGSGEIDVSDMLA